jgi:hypothetical protein
MHALTDVSAFISPAVPATLQYWLQKCSGQRVPHRRDIDVIDMPRSVLPHLLLVDVENRPFRVKFRLVGTHAARMYNFDFTGR